MQPTSAAPTSPKRPISPLPRAISASDYEKNNLMFYHLNLGANLSKSVEFIIGISSWDISVSRKENGVVGSKYNSKYSIYNLGLGILF